MVSTEHRCRRLGMDDKMMYAVVRAGVAYRMIYALVFVAYLSTLSHNLTHAGKRDVNSVENDRLITLITAMN